MDRPGVLEFGGASVALNACIVALIACVVAACITLDPVPDAPAYVGPNTLIYESALRIPEGRIDSIRVASHPLLNPTLPAYFVGYILETPRSDGSRNRDLAAVTTDAAFRNPSFLDLGPGFPRRLTTLRDAIWVGSRAGGGSGAWMLVGTSTGREGPLDRTNRYWYWVDRPIGPGGVRGFLEFTVVPAADERTIGRQYDLISAGGSFDKADQFIVVARRTEGTGEFAQTNCVVAWVLNTLALPPPHDPLGIYRNDPFILDCASGTGSIGQIAVSALAVDTGAWLIAYTKNNQICARAVAASSTLTTAEIATPYLPDCVTSMPALPGLWSGHLSLPIRALVVDGGARSRFLLAFSQDAPGGSGSPATVTVSPLMVLPSGTPSVVATGPVRTLGRTTGNLRLAQESTTGVHWVLLDGGGVGGDLSYTRVRRFGHTGQIVQEFALQPPPWPFDHDVAFHANSDRFGVVRPLLEPVQGLYGRTVPHSQMDQVVFLGANCDGTIAIGPLVPPELHADASGSLLSNVRHFAGHDVYWVRVSGAAPSVDDLTLTWSPLLIAGTPGACDAAPDDAFPGATVPAYLPPASSTTFAADGTGALSVPISLSDTMAGALPGTFPGTDNVPVNRVLYFQWTWTVTVVVPPEPDGPDVPVIQHLKKRSNIAQVSFNP